jgi:dihydrofolate reductase
MKVKLVMAVTVDGKIARSADHFPDWTGKEDKRLFVEITRNAGVVIMGSKTFDTIKKPLPGRKNVVLSRNKKRVSKWDNLIFTHEKPALILKQLEQEGYKKAVLAGGASINSLFAEANLIDEIYITIAPLAFGSGISMFGESITMDLELMEIKRLDENIICLRYRVL